MRIFIPPVSSATFSDWYDLDYRQKSFSAYIAARISAAANLTFSIEYTLDDPNQIPTFVTASQTTTTITVTFPSAHNALVGDYVELLDTGTAMDGKYAVAGITSSTVLTLTNTSGTHTGGTFSAARVCRVGTIVSAKTATTDTTLSAPVNAIRLNVTAYTSGSVYAQALQGDSN